MNLKIRLLSKNKTKIGVKLETSFVNKKKEEFEMYFAERYYEINIESIDQEIIDKAQEIINEDSNYPNYHKIGNYI